MQAGRDGVSRQIRYGLLRLGRNSLNELWDLILGATAGDALVCATELKSAHPQDSSVFPMLVHIIPRWPFGEVDDMLDLERPATKGALKANEGS